MATNKILEYNSILKIMKRICTFLIIVLYFLPFSFTQAQENWVSYIHSIDVKNLKEQQIRLQMSIRTEIEDADAAARFGFRVVTPNNDGFREFLKSRVKDTSWTTYTIVGNIDSTATRIRYSPHCQHNGKFYFDDIKIDVRTGDHEWKNIFTENFEHEPLKLEQGLRSGNYGKNEKFHAEIHTENTTIPNKCLLITGKGVPNYGNNKKAGKYADINGIKLYYEIYGEGHPFLYLHGNGGSISNCSKFMPHLINKYKVIAIDSRAQGLSTDADEPLSYIQMTADINALLDKLNIDSTYIWGQSDGAILGLILAMKHPDKVKKLLAFGANIQPDSLAVFQCAINDSKRIVRETKDERKRKLEQLMIDYPNIPYADLSFIKAPVLVIAGDRDIIRPEHTLKIFQHTPNSHLCIIPGTTHGASWEKKDLFLSILDDFFEDKFIMPDTRDWFR